MATWKDKIEKIRENGEKTMMIAPQIISCSRSTDIPAFYADWFFHRLKVGYVAWTNPFNGQQHYVAVDNLRFIVFWSKNPRPLLKHFEELEERGIHCYVQFTLNDYEQERIELQVPRLEQRIETFHLLRERLGQGGVVWRFDPLVLTDKIGVDELLRKVERIGDELKGATEKLVFSFADILEYRKVKANLERSGIAYRLWDLPQMQAMTEGLSELNQKWGYELATCSEKIDLEAYGVAHNRCIDGDLIVRRAYDDAVLMNFMGVRFITPEMSLFGESNLPEGAIALPDGRYFMSVHKKDNGQRVHCGCMAAKDIGEYNTCPHQCEYCYANTSKQLALQNFKQHQKAPFSETITGK